MGRQRERKQSRSAVPQAVMAGQSVETTIERIVPGGFGLAHAEGRTLFVAGAAEGDRALVRIERTPGKMHYARIVELIEASPDRIEAPYPLLARCGIDFQHLRYEAQLAAKLGIVRDCLRRIGGIDPPAELPMHPSPHPWGYRGRAEWRHEPERRILGYRETGTHQVVDLEADPMVEPVLATRYADLRAQLDRGSLPDVAEFKAAAGDEGTISLSPVGADAAPAVVTRRVGEERYAFDADCFFQPNPLIAADLIAEALRHAPPVGGAAGAEERPALDLFCGVGLFTLPLARRFGRVVGVESHARTASFAVRNAEAAGLRGIRIETMPVERWSAAAYRTFGRTPFVLLDPPRTGLAPSALRGLLRLRPERIAYVSCDPATLSRDLKLLIGEGYTLGDLAAFDMFPQSHHVEIVAHLARAAEGDAAPSN